MCLDNLCWISASPEYESFKKLPLFFWNKNSLTIYKNTYKSKISYIIKYRIWTVIKHPRDIIPAIISSMILTIIWK